MYALTQRQQVLSTKNDRIVQIAFATLNSQGRLSTCKMTIDPCIPISLSASRVHGITNQDINGFPKFSQRAQFIYETLHNQIICGYNSKRFDMPLLNNELVRNNMKQLKTKHHIDVMFLAKKKLSLPSYKLGNVYQAISGKKNLDNKQLHDALYDTLTTLATLYNLEVAIGNRASLIVQQANQKTPHISSDVIHKGKLAGRKLDKKLVIRYAHYLEYIKNTKWDTCLNPDQWQKVATYMNKARKDPNTPWFQGNTIFWKSPKNKLHFTFGRYAWEKDLSLDKLLKNENNNGYVSYRKYLVKNKICTEEYLNQAEKCAKEQA